MAVSESHRSVRSLHALVGGRLLAGAATRLPATTLRLWGEVVSVRQGEERWFLELMDARCDSLVMSVSLPLASGPPEVGHSIGVEGQLRVRAEGASIVTELCGTSFETAGPSRRSRERRALLADVRSRIPPPVDLATCSGGTVVVVTSPASRAYGDFLRNLGSVGHRPDVELEPARLQDPADIARGIAAAAARPDIGLLVLTRGGGDAGELAAFSSPEVTLAVATAAARVPVVVGVGHASDWTLADEVASRSASTPSQAARVVAWAYGRAHQDRQRPIRRPYRRSRRRTRRVFLAAIVVAAVAWVLGNCSTLRHAGAPRSPTALPAKGAAASAPPRASSPPRP